MLSFKDLTEKKKTNVLINPKKADLQEKNHGEDCDCLKCEKKRRSEDVNDGPDIATEESCGKGMYYCHDDKKCKPIPKGYKEGKDGMLVAESKAVGAVVKQLARIGAKKLKSKKVKKAIYKKGKEIAKKVGSAGLEGATDAAVDRAREVGSDTVKNVGKKKKKIDEAEVYWSSKALDQLDEINAKERFKRDAGAIAKKKMRNKEHRKYVNFLDVDENTIHSFNTFIQNNKPYDSQKEVSEESDKESKVETSLLKFSECWKTHKKVGMKMKGGKLVNDCRPKTASDYKKEEVELDEKVYTGPDKKDRALIKKMDNPSYAKKLADYEKNMDPKKRQALKDKATKGMKFTHEAANPAQQAAIAIDMKKKGKKPKDVQEATRLKKEMGYDKGGTKKPTAPKQKDTALDMIRKKYKDQLMKRGQPKKVKGAKSTVGTGKYKKMADQKKQTAADAKKRGFKNTKDYVETMARYGGKDNYDKGKGLGT